MKSIFDQYKDSIERTQGSRRAIDDSIRSMREGFARDGRYSARAICAQSSAEDVLRDPNNGLSPSEKADFKDKIRFVPREVSYFFK